MTRKLFAFALAAALAAPSLAVAGGHATISVAELPKSFVAGQTVNVAFTIHDAVGHPVTKVKPTVIATLGKRRLVVPATAVKQEGGYVAAVKFPAAGAWTLTVDSKYCGNTRTINDVAVLAAK